MDYHTIVIGSGSGGLTVAVGLGKLGKSVLLVEKETIGGDCTNYGCVPSKSLLHAASSNLKNPFLYTQSKVKHFIYEDKKALKSLKTVSFVEGSAEFVNPHTVRVHGEKTHDYSAKHIVIATGSSPRVVEIEGLPDNKLLTNKTIFSLKKAPKHLAIIGGGFISIEMAHAFADLGSKVSIVTRGNRILSSSENSVSKAVEKTLVGKGITIYKNASNYKWEKSNLSFESNNTEITLSDLNEGILQAVGRIPNTKSLKLENAGVQTHNGHILVNKRYQTSHSAIYAIGDCTTQGGFTHLANAQGRVVVSRIAFPFLPTPKISTVPKVVFSSPEFAETGLSYKEIQNLDKDSYYKLEPKVTDTDRGTTDDIKNTYFLAYIERITGKILRVVYIAPNAGESIGYWQSAIENKIRAWKLYFGILPYPTLSLVFKKSLDKFVEKSLVNIRTDLGGYIKRFVFRHKKLLSALTIWISLIGVSRIAINKYGLTGIEFISKLGMLMQSSTAGVILYVLTYALRPILLIPAIPLTALAGLIYGLRDGYLIGLFAGTCSALLPYYTARYIHRHKKHSENITIEHTSNNPFLQILTLRLLYIPYDLVSVYAGHRGIALIPFITATLIGNLIGTLTFVSLGASLSLEELVKGNINFNPAYIALSIVLAVTTIMGTSLYKKNRKVQIKVEN